VLVLINARTLESAVRVIVQNVRTSRYTARRLIDAIKVRHTPIEAHFHSGAGCWLQRMDADMAERVLLELIRHGIVALPIHDSFIVPARYEDAAREAMNEAFETVISRGSRVSRIHQSVEVDKADQSYTMVTTFPPPVPEFFDASHRITLAGRAAALQAKRQRGIRQDTFAHLIAICRPTLANILTGPFGASPQTAQRIAEIIMLTPAFERQPFLPGLAE
jgi:hypothetical protein